MKKNYIYIISFISISVLFILLGCSKPQRPTKTCNTFQELADPTSDTLSDWSNAPLKLQASLTDIDTRYPKSVCPDLEKISSTQLVGWKREKLSAQLLLWSGADVKQVECEFTDFKSSTSHLPSDIAHARFVRYVMTDVFGEGCGYRKPEDYPSSLVPDMLDNLDCFDIPAKTVRPVWLTIEIPASAPTGLYTSKLKIFAEGKESLEIKIELKVQDKTLPPASEWEYHLDLWQHPSAVARAQNLELWSDEHFEAMKPLMTMLANAGQKVITTTLNKDPWNNQTFDRYEDMIVWTKNNDGSWTYDYTIFDKWVTFMMQDIGITKMINCYSLVPWNNELHYKDSRRGKMINVKADPGTKIFEEMWKPFLLDFKNHLAEKGWLGMTNIAMDERSPEMMTAAIKLLQEIVPELGISLADNHKSYKKYPFIRDMSMSANAKVDLSDIEYRKEKGYITTFYVCCADKFPNMFTCSEPIEAVYSAWYATAAGYDGFLRWAYNSWVQDPLTDSRFRTWPAGDTYIVYPEARSSIRFERLIEGIQDVEKIRVLKNQLIESKSDESLKKLDKLNNEVNKFNTITPQQPIEMIHSAKATIEELSE